MRDSARDQINETCHKDWLKNMRVNDKQMQSLEKCFSTKFCNDCFECMKEGNIPNGSEVFADLKTCKAIIKELCNRVKPLLESVNGECYQGKDAEENMVYEIRHFMKDIGEYDHIIKDEE